MSMMRMLRTRGAGIACLLLALVLAACSGTKRPDTVAAPNVPQTFDLTVHAFKDGQFDLDGATLSGEDFKGHLKYRVETNNPVQTVLLTRGEKQKVTDRHIAELAKAAFELKFRAFVQEDKGKEIEEIRLGTAGQ